MDSSERRGRYRFSDFELDIDRGTLRRSGREVSLRPKAFAVLQHLVVNQGKLVSRDELIEAVWGHPHVSDSSLNQCLRDIRRALDDHDLKIVHTVPRRGYRFDPSDEQPEAVVSTDGKVGGAGLFSTPLFYVIAALFVAVLLYITFHEQVSHVEEPGQVASTGSPVSIAVLPMLDLSPAADLGYLADGLAEEILNSLAQSDDLRVIARTSSFAFRGEDADLSEIASALDVELVFQGSVRRSGDLVRVTAQLIDTRSQAHIWSRSYDYALADLFDLQLEVARDVFETLQSELASIPRETGAGPGGQAYEAYLVGVHFLRRGDMESLKLARQNLELATSLEPDFAPAWSKLSDCYRRLGFRSPENSEYLFSAYLEAAERALTLDPGLPEAAYLEALMLRFQGRYTDFINAIVEGLYSGIDDPDFLLLAMGDAIDYGQFDAAISFGNKALRIDPLSGIGRNNLGYALIGAQRLEEALAEFGHLQSIHPGSDSWKVGKSITLLLMARHDEAVEMAEAISGEDTMRELLIALAMAGKGETSRARVLAESIEPADELQRLTVMVTWFAFTNQREDILLALERIRQEFPVVCRGPNNVTCGQLAEMWGSPFFQPFRDDPQVLEWVNQLFPGYSERLALRKTVYQDWMTGHVSRKL